MTAVVMADDAENGPPVSLPAFPAQLPAGKEPGTYHFSEMAYVKFSQQAEFPVDYVLENYAHKEVFRTSIKDESPVVVACDLKPGSYEALYQMTGKAKADYWGEAGTEFFINVTGQRGYTNGSQISYQSFPAYDGPIGHPNIIFRKKIKLIGPASQTIVTGKQIHFEWESVPGIKAYTVIIWPIQHPDHPDSGYSAETARYSTEGSGLTASIGIETGNIFLQPGNIYSWTVQDQSDNENVSDGRIARSDSRILFTSGAKEHLAKLSGNYMRDEMIEPRLGIRLLQPYQTSDGSEVYLTIVGVGGQTPAMASGLVPGDQIVSFDGKPVRTLNEFHNLLTSAPVGKTVTIETIYYDSKAGKMLNRSHPLVLP
jgi:hypothetical protein